MTRAWTACNRSLTPLSHTPTRCFPQLTFFKTKAISFPGGDKFQPLSDCEIDPRADGCDADDE